VIRSSSGKTVARRTLIGALALLIPAITGCEAGLNAPTLEFHPAAAGTTTVFNGIKISDMFVLGAPSGASVPSGSSASMFLSLFNNGANNDHLVSVSAPGSAATVKLSGGTVSLPVQSLVDLTGPEPSVVLSNLTKPLAGGQAILVTLDFQHAGKVKLEVPVEPQSFYYSTYSPPPATAAATASSTPTP
jgi:copper(I)-binding protein